MAQEIKKTMVKPLEMLAGWVGSTVTAEMLEDFTNQFGYKADGTTSTGPRELTILRVDIHDTDSEVLGRKCTVTGRFFPIDRFAKNTSCIKEADSAKGKLYNESKTMEKDAQKILDDARELTDPIEKVAMFEDYDLKLQEAAAHRKQEVVVPDEALDGSFETMEEMAEHFGVDLNAPKPVSDEE